MTSIVRRTSIAIPVVLGTLVLPGLLFTSDRLQAFAQRWTPFAGFSIQHTVDRPDYHAGPWHGLGVNAAYAVIALVGGAPDRSTPRPVATRRPGHRMGC